MKRIWMPVLGALALTGALVASRPARTAPAKGAVLAGRLAMRAPIRASEPSTGIQIRFMEQSSCDR